MTNSDSSFAEEDLRNGGIKMSPISKDGEMQIENIGKPEFETILDTVGHFGPYQGILFTLTAMLDVMTGMIMTYHIFSTAAARWQCLEFSSGINSSNLSAGGNLTFEGMCDIDGDKCIKFEFDDGFSSTCITSEWTLICDHAYIPRLTTTCLMLGTILGALITGHLVDQFGRRRILIAIASVLCVSQVIVGLSVNWSMYAAMRFFVGIALGGALGNGFPYCLEFLGPRWRIVCGTLGFFELGTALLALLAYWTQDWRHLAYTTGSICLPLVIAIAIFVPESIRWQLQRHRFFDATQVVRRMAKINRRPMPEKILLKHIGIAHRPAGEKLGCYTYADLFTTANSAKLTVVLMISWFAHSCTYYILSGSLTPLHDSIFITTVITSIPGMAVGWMAISFANWFGRRRICLILTVPVLVILIINAIRPFSVETSAFKILTLVATLLTKCSWTILAVLTAELYPTLTRGLGVGISNTSARVGAVLAPQIIFLGDSVHHSFPLIITGFFLLVSSIPAFILLPETNRQSLFEDIPRKDNFISIVRNRCICQSENDDDVEEMEPISVDRYV